LRLQGWEQFDEPVDRTVSIGAFEHFGFDRYDEFFTLAHEILPYDGIPLLHTITALTLPHMADLLHALPHRMRQRLPDRLHRRQPVHAVEVASNKERIIRCRNGVALEEACHGADYRMHWDLVCGPKLSGRGDPRESPASQRAWLGCAGCSFHIR
jgi:hypothetical protein